MGWPLGWTSWGLKLEIGGEKNLSYNSPAQTLLLISRNVLLASGLFPLSPPWLNGVEFSKLLPWKPLFLRGPPLPQQTHTPLISHEFLEARWGTMVWTVHSWNWLVTKSGRGLVMAQGRRQHILFPGCSRLPQAPYEHFPVTSIPTHL